jgi:PKD repeat protein
MLHYGTSSRSYTAQVDVGNTTSRTVSNLTDGSKYYFAVTAYDQSRVESGFSNEVVATVPSALPVANFSASTTTGTAPLSINFINGSTGSITAYAWTFGDGTTSTSQNPVHVYSVAGTYTVSLKVTGPGGTSTKTLASYVKVTAPATADATPPSAPSSLVAAASGSTTINLKWNASSDDKGVTGYRIERCQGASCTTFVQIATSTGTTYSNAGLAANTSYGYRVRAYDAAGRLSGYSNTAWATTGSGTTAKTLTTTALTATPNPSLTGAVVTFTATVTGNAPSGTIKFTDSGISISGCSAIVLAGTGNVRKGSCATTALTAGSHIVTAAYAGDSLNAASTSSSITQVVNAPTGVTNVALAASGAVATASSSYGAGYMPAVTIDNRRSGAGWANGGGWMDGTKNAFPDWLQVKFNGTKTIDRVVVYSVQDNFVNPVEPTDTMTFSLYGLTDFLVQGFNGVSWVTLATVSGNNRVKRAVTFTPYTTDRIRVLVNRGGSGYSRVTKIEVWTAASTVSQNFALAANGAVSTASSSYGTGYTPAATIDNKRSGARWANGGGWMDGTRNVFPDWLQVQFNGTKTIDRVVVYSVQDNFVNPVEPTDTMTFSLYGLQDFLVQGFNGAGWVTLATVSGNTRVKRTVTFTPFATDRIRIYVNRGAGGYSRATEVEAWGR